MDSLDNKNKRKVIAIVLNEGRIISWGINEHTSPCLRKGLASGIDYGLCPQCNYPNHAEVKAIQGVTSGHVLVIGHAFVCDYCQSAMKKKGFTWTLWN